MQADSRPQRTHPAVTSDQQPLPVSDSDRLLRGLPLESGEPQPHPGTLLH